jgi:hypothetical protein
MDERFADSLGLARLAADAAAEAVLMIDRASVSDDPELIETLVFGALESLRDAESKSWQAYRTLQQVELVEG